MWTMIVFIMGASAPIHVTGFWNQAACLSAAEKTVNIWPQRGINVTRIICKKQIEV
jgi:hypothetical protein